MRPAIFTRLLLISTILVTVLLAARVWDAEHTAGRVVGITFAEESDVPTVSDLSAGFPAERAGVQVGDVIVGVNDQVVTSFAELFEAAKVFKRDHPVTFSVQRQNEAITLKIRPGIPLAWGMVGLDLLAALGYLSLALLARFRAPDDLRARLLAGFSIAVAVELSLPEAIPGLAAWPLARNVLYYLLSGVQIGLELHLTSAIPTRYRWFTERPWLVNLYYGIGFAAGLIPAAFVLADGLGMPGLEQITTSTTIIFNNFLLVAWGVAIVAILLVQLRCSKTSGHRSQARLILIGVLPWTIFNIANSVQLHYDLATPGWALLLQPLVLLLYPVTIFIAVFRYHLFDIKVALKRSLVLISVSVVVIAVFLLVVDTGARKAGEELGAGHLPVAAFAFAMVALGLAFNPVRRQIQSLIDRRFYPERLKQRDQLADLAANLPTLGNLSSMGQHLVEAVVQAFRVEGATLLVADPQSGVLVSLASITPETTGPFESSLLLEANDAGIEQLRKARRPIPADIIGSTSPALAQRINAFGAELGVGLVSGNTLVGLLLLGPKKDSEKFRSEELDLLRLLSINVATVFENVRLFQSATYEQLTGLLRREAILQALEAEIQRATRYDRPLTVGMVDLDRFKTVNDSWGHLAGDALLQRVAAVLRDNLRSIDRIGRYGGEEFLFFLPETELEDGIVVAEKLRAAVENLTSPIDEAPDLRITTSIGLAELGPQNTTQPAPPTQIIAAADRALLNAKKQGRNLVVSEPEVEVCEAKE